MISNKNVYVYVKHLKGDQMTGGSGMFADQAARGHIGICANDGLWPASQFNQTEAYIWRSEFMQGWRLIKKILQIRVPAQWSTCRWNSSTLRHWTTPKPKYSHLFALLLAFARLKLSSTRLAKVTKHSKLVAQMLRNFEVCINWVNLQKKHLEENSLAQPPSLPSLSVLL